MPITAAKTEKVSVAVAPELCFHCGQRLPLEGSYKVLINHSEQSMCCPGCAAVASTIAGMGLEDYYRYRTEPANKADNPDAAAQEIWRIYDREDMQTSFVSELDADRREAGLLIEGITCAACGWLIETRLRQLNGISECSLNLGNKRARVVWRPREIELSAILGAIESMGYKPHPYRASHYQQLLAQEHKSYLKRLGVAGIGMMQVMMYAIALYAGAFEGMDSDHQNLLRWASLIVATPVALYAAYPFHYAAFRGLRAGSVGMDTPVSLAIIGAYAASLVSTFVQGEEVYFDSVCMFTFFLLLGRFLELRIRMRLSQSILQLQKILPDRVTLIDGNQEKNIAMLDLQPGDTVLVKAGQRVPADGIILEGHSVFDQAQLTGEFDTVSKAAGARIIAGSINKGDPVSMRVTAVGKDSQLAKIQDLVEQASSTKPPAAIFADRAARLFVTAILILATLVALSWWFIAPERAFWITLSVLVATCPCALSLATPVALMAASSRLQRSGFLIQGPHTLETLARADQIVFDKTGTLTQGAFKLEKILPLADLNQEQCLRLASLLEAASEHPIAAAFDGAQLVTSPDATSSAPSHSAEVAQRVRVCPGQGLEGSVVNRRLRIGRPEYVLALSNQTVGSLNPKPQDDLYLQPQANHGSWILLGDTAGPLAWFQLADRLREDAGQATATLRSLGVNVAILSGDHAANVSDIARRLGIEAYLADQSPLDKVRYLQQQQHNGHTTIMAGDGINDAPVIAAADVSIAMINASDMTKARADAVLLSGELALIGQAIQLARRTKRVIRQNISWALLYNLTILPAAALGLVAPYVAALGMSMSSLAVVLNASRLANSNKKQPRLKHQRQTAE